MQTEGKHYLKYTRNYLTEVIARVDFLGAVEDLRNSLPSPLANLVSKAFPILEPQKLVAQELQLSPGGVQASGQPTQQNEWRFYGANRDKFLALSAESVLVRYERYESFENVLAEFLPPIDYFAKAYPELQARRLGLRYINNINPKGAGPFSWSKLIKRNMLCILDVLEPTQAIARAFHNLELNFGNYRLRFQYGLHNPDYPAPIKQRVFVMDFDAFAEAPQALSDLCSALVEYHQAIQTAFEASITDALRAQMND